MAVTCRGYSKHTLPWDSDWRNECPDPPDSYRCSVCDAFCWDECAHPHSLDLYVCNNPDCIAAAIRKMKATIKEYKVAVKCISELEVPTNPAMILPTLLSAKLAALMAINKVGDGI